MALFCCVAVPLFTLFYPFLPSNTPIYPDIPRFTKSVPAFTPLYQKCTPQYPFDCDIREKEARRVRANQPRGRVPVPRGEKYNDDVRYRAFALLAASNNVRAVAKKLNCAYFLLPTRRTLIHHVVTSILAEAFWFVKCGC